MTLDSLAMTGDTPHSRSHRLGGWLRCVFLVLALGFLGVFVAPDTAEAHGLHAEESATDLAEKAPATGENLGVTAQCETTCCLPATCASALVSLHDPSPRFDASSERLSFPSDARVAGLMQNALKRPPRA